MTTTTLEINLDQALFDPASVFGRPEDVIEHHGLTTDHKIEILRRWTYDAIEMAVAEEEGMDGPDGVPVDKILAALHRLTKGHHPKCEAPTKHATV